MPATDASLAETVAALPEDTRESVLSVLAEDELRALEHDWQFWARPKQLPPDGDWRTWVIRTGRGWGKTRTGAEWLHQRAKAEPGRRMALVAQTPADARDYCIEGPGGLLNNRPLWCVNEGDEWPNYEPSKRRVTWPNGSRATIYSSEEPRQLRGFSGDTAWLDEFAKWTNPRECWDNLMYGMRETSTDRPRVCITTTPRPLPVLQEIEAKGSSRVVTGSSYENRANLDPTWFDEILADYEGTTLGRQEIHAEILDEYPGALWSRDVLDEARLSPGDDLPPMHRIVVAVDPAVTSGEDADETGIIVAAKGQDGLGYVLEDRTCRKSPDGWAAVAVAAYRDHQADRVVAEVNNGGDLVENVLRTHDASVSYRGVRASRGKRTRAEPVAALYEQSKVRHKPGLDELEDQMVAFLPDQRKSPDRVDALVWAMTELMVQGTRSGKRRSVRY